MRGDGPGRVRDWMLSGLAWGMFALVLAAVAGSVLFISPDGLS